MARRKARKSDKKKVGYTPWMVGGAFALALIGILVFKPSGSVSTEKQAEFRVSEYRDKGGSTLTGNRYTLEGKVENIISRGNDRLVSISLRDNSRERLPLLVKGNTGVNLSRGDSFLFEVECVSGQDAAGQPVKGVLVVKNVSIK